MVTERRLEGRKRRRRTVEQYVYSSPKFHRIFSPLFRVSFVGGYFLFFSFFSFSYILSLFISSVLCFRFLSYILICLIDVVKARSRSRKTGSKVKEISPFYFRGEKSYTLEVLRVDLLPKVLPEPYHNLDP